MTYLDEHPFATPRQHDVTKPYQPVVANGIDQPVYAQMVAGPLPSTSAHPTLANYAQVRHELFKGTQRTHSDEGVMVVWRRLRDERLYCLTLFVCCFHLHVITAVGCPRVLQHHKCVLYTFLQYEYTREGQLHAPFMVTVYSGRSRLRISLDSPVKRDRQELRPTCHLPRTIPLPHNVNSDDKHSIDCIPGD